jgi:hypothetical protein
MKKNIIYLFGCFSMISLLLTGCTDKLESVTATIESTINGKAVDQVAVSLNSFLSYEFTVQSSAKVGRMELIKNVNGVNSGVAIIGYATSSSEKIAGSVEVTSEMKLTLNLYDKAGITIIAGKTIQIKIFVTTNVISEITLTSAKTGGVIADVGGGVTARGVCWSTLPNPTIDLSTKTSDGTGTGAFVSDMKNLAMGTTYYVRSYVVSSQGVLYGNEQKFTTLSPPVPAIPNGGFEAPVISGFVMNPQPNVWTFTGGGAGMQANGSAFGAKTAPEGVQTALFQQAASISQSMDFPAGNYAISFKVAQRGTQAQTFEVYFDNILIGKVQPATSDFELFVSDTFTATAGTHKITITGTNAKSGDNSGFVDDVKLLYRP